MAVAREERLLVPSETGASTVARNRVPRRTPSAPSTSAAASRPRRRSLRRRAPAPARPRATCGTITTEARRPAAAARSPGRRSRRRPRRRPRPRRRSRDHVHHHRPASWARPKISRRSCSGDGHAVEKTRGPVASTASTDSSAANSSRLSPNGRVVRPDPFDRRCDTVGIEVGHAHDAEAAGLRDRGDERRVGKPLDMPASTTGWSTPRTGCACRDHRPRGRRDIIAPQRSSESWTPYERVFYSSGMRVEYREEPCRSALNRVKGMPFDWSLNPYTGCATVAPSVTSAPSRRAPTGPRTTATGARSGSRSTSPTSSGGSSRVRRGSGRPSPSARRPTRTSPPRAAIA